MRHHHPYVFLRRILLAGALLSCGLVQACARLGLGSVRESQLSITSVDGNLDVKPRFITAAYGRIDQDSADVFLSDLPQDRLTDPTDDLAGLSGSLIHIHLFLIPEAGHTPIDPTACDFTVRHIILAADQDGGGTVMGMYGGGGFLLPSGRPGDRRFGGSISDATHRLIRAQPGFQDLLGSAALSGRFSAPKDEKAAAALAARFASLTPRIPPVPADGEPEADKP